MNALGQIVFSFISRKS